MECMAIPQHDSAAHEQRIRRWWAFGILAVLFVILFRQELITLVERWSDPQESHGLLIPLFSLYFLYQDRRRIAETIGKASLIGLVLMVVSVLGYAWFLYISMGYPRKLCMIALIGSLVLFLGGWRMVRWTWLPIAYLVFAIPLPARLYYQITIPMRKLASSVAAGLLDMLPDITAQATGVVIDGVRTILKDGLPLSEPFSLNVAEACSGMRLLTAFVALGVAMAYLEYRPAIHRLILLVSTIPIAIFCNMLRVLLTGLIHIYIGSDYATGTLHTVLGMVMLVVAFSLYGLLAWILNRLFIDPDDDDEGILVINASASAASDARQESESKEGHE